MHGMKWIMMFHGLLDNASSPPQNRETVAILKSHNILITTTYCAKGPT